MAKNKRPYSDLREAAQKIMTKGWDYDNENRKEEANPNVNEDQTGAESSKPNNSGMPGQEQNTNPVQDNSQQPQNNFEKYKNMYDYPEQPQSVKTAQDIDNISNASKQGRFASPQIHAKGYTPTEDTRMPILNIPIPSGHGIKVEDKRQLPNLIQSQFGMLPEAKADVGERGEVDAIIEKAKSLYGTRDTKSLIDAIQRNPTPEGEAAMSRMEKYAPGSVMALLKPAPGFYMPGSKEFENYEWGSALDAAANSALVNPIGEGFNALVTKPVESGTRSIAKGWEDIFRAKSFGDVARGTGHIAKGSLELAMSGILPMSTFTKYSTVSNGVINPAIKLIGDIKKVYPAGERSAQFMHDLIAFNSLSPMLSELTRGTVQALGGTDEQADKIIKYVAPFAFGVRVGAWGNIANATDSITKSLVNQTDWNEEDRNLAVDVLHDIVFFGGLAAHGAVKNPENQAIKDNIKFAIRRNVRGFFGLRDLPSGPVSAERKLEPLSDAAIFSNLDSSGDGGAKEFTAEQLTHIGAKWEKLYNKFKEAGYKSFDDFLSQQTPEAIVQFKLYRKLYKNNNVTDLEYQEFLDKTFNQTHSNPFATKTNKPDPTSEYEAVPLKDGEVLPDMELREGFEKANPSAPIKEKIIEPETASVEQEKPIEPVIKPEVPTIPEPVPVEDVSPVAPVEPDVPINTYTGTKSGKTDEQIQLEAKQSIVDLLDDYKLQNTPSGKNGIYREARRRVNELRKQGVNADLRQGKSGWEFSIDGVKQGKRSLGVTASKPKADLGQIDVRETASKPYEELPKEVWDNQLNVAETLVDPSDLPHGMGEKGLSKAIADIKEDNGKELSPEAKVVREVAEDILENGKEVQPAWGYRKKEFISPEEIKADIERRLSENPNEEGDTSFDFGANTADSEIIPPVEPVKKAEDPKSLVEEAEEYVPIPKTELNDAELSDRFYKLKDIADLEKLVDEVGDFPIHVKDTNGSRAIMRASAYKSFAETPGVKERVEKVSLAKGDIDKPQYDKNFMEGVGEDKPKSSDAVDMFGNALPKDKIKSKPAEQIQMEGLGAPSMKGSEDYLDESGKGEGTTPLFNQGTESDKSQEDMFEEEPQQQEEPKAKKENAGYGKENKVVTEDRYEELKQKLKDKFKKLNTTNDATNSDYTGDMDIDNFGGSNPDDADPVEFGSGLGNVFGAIFDKNFSIKDNFKENSEGVKEVLREGAEFFKDGFNKFASWSKEMLNKFGEKIKPFLMKIYNAVKKGLNEILKYAKFEKPIMDMNTFGATGFSIFYDKDVKPKVEDSISGVMKLKDDIQKIFSPVSRGANAKLAAEVIREHSAELARKKEMLYAYFDNIRKHFDKQPDNQNIDFMDGIETGKLVGTPAEQMFATEIRKVLDSTWKEIQLRSGSESYIENYFPHLWKDPKKAKDIFSQVYGRSPISGNKSFLKQREHPTIKDGIAAGLEPASTNPVEIALTQLYNMNKFIMAKDTIREFKDKNIIKFVRFGNHAPDGYAQLSDPVARVYQYDETVKGMIHRGNYYMPEQAATIFNNYLSPGIQFSGYKLVRATGNLMNQIQLGLSAFHLAFTSIDAMTSMLALSVQEASQGRLIESTKSIALTPVAAFTTIFQGNKLLKQYYDTNPILSEMTKNIIMAGGRVKMDSFYKNNSFDNFFKAFRQGNYPGAILRLPFAAIEGLSKPLMEYVVPRQKLGVFYYLAKNINDTAIKKNWDTDQLRTALQEAWDSVDNRMGQLVYDNLFWNKTLKDLSMVVVRSVGWNIGDIRELAGGAKEWASMPLNLARGKGFRITPRMAYLVALPILTGLLGAIYMYLSTGKAPSETKDYFYPKSGGQNPDGTDERIALPTYTKDVYAYSKRPLTTILHKMHPLVSMAADMMANKDFFGYEIADPNDGFMENVKDELNFVAKQFAPMSVTTTQQQKGAGKEGTGAYASFIGVVPAAKYVTNSDIQNEIYDIYWKRNGGGIKSQDSKATADVKKEITQLYRSGKDKEAQDMLQKAMDNGLIHNNSMKDQTYIKQYEKKTKLGPDVSAFKALPAADQEHLLMKMDDKELLKYGPNTKMELLEKPEIKKAIDRVYEKMNPADQAKINRHEAGKPYREDGSKKESRYSRDYSRSHAR